MHNICHNKICKNIYAILCKICISLCIGIFCIYILPTLLMELISSLKFQTSFIQVITWMKRESKDISFPYCLLLLKIWALGHFSRIDEERTVGFISKTDGRSHDHLVLVYAVLFVSAEEAPQYSNNACVDARGPGPFQVRLPPNLKDGKLMPLLRLRRAWDIGKRFLRCTFSSWFRRRPAAGVTPGPQDSQAM